MLRKVLILTTLSLLTACNVQVSASTWVGGQYGLWSDSTNWSPLGIPTGDVTISSVGSTVYIIVDIDPDIYSLHTYGSVDLLGGVKLPGGRFQITAPNDVTNHGGLEIHEIEIAGDLNNSNGAEVELSGPDIYGRLFNPAGGEIVVWCSSEVNGKIQNAGLLTFDPQSELSVEPDLHNTGQIQIYGSECSVDELFGNDSTGVVKGFGIFKVGQLLQNKGAIYASGGSLAVLSKGSITNTGTLANKVLSSLHIQPANDVNNNGTIEVNAGGGVAFDCNLVNEPNGVIKLLGGTLSATTITQTADANFAGFGGITGDVVIDPNGLIKLTGPTNVVGDVTISPNATLEVSDGLTLITGHTTCNGTIRMLGGYIIPQGDLSGSCNVIWEPGLYINIADFNLDGHVNLKDFALFADTWLWQTSWH